MNSVALYSIYNGRLNYYSYADVYIRCYSEGIYGIHRDFGKLGIL